MTLLPESRRPYLVMGILLVFAAVLLFRYAQTYPTGADQTGYIMAGQRLASGQGVSYQGHPDPAKSPFFSMFAFQIRAGDARMMLGFPPGLPILLAAGILLTGMYNAIFYVVPFFAVMGLVVLFILSLFWSENPWTGAWAALILLSTIDYWHFGTDVWAAIPSIVMILSGILFYSLSRQERLPARRKQVFALLGALFLIFSLFIRYANVTVFIAIGLAEIITTQKRFFREWQQRFPFYLYLLAGCVGILIFNQTYYGGYFLTSYSPENGWYTFAPFSWEYALNPSPINGFSLIETGKSLWTQYTGFLLLAPIGLLWLKGNRLLTLLIVLGMIGLYSMYAFAPVDVNSRFLLPILPFISLGIAQFITKVGSQIPRDWLRWLAAFILILYFCWPLPQRLEMLALRNMQDSTKVAEIRQMVKALPIDAVYMSYALNDVIAMYGARSVLNYRRIPQYDPQIERIRYDLYEGCLIYLIDDLLSNNRPVYFVVDQQPSVYETIPRLENSYQLTRAYETPLIFQVKGDPKRMVRGSIGNCYP